MINKKKQKLSIDSFYFVQENNANLLANSWLILFRTRSLGNFISNLNTFN